MINTKNTHQIIATTLLCIFLLTACTVSDPGPEGSVEKYLQALNAKDAASISALSCSGWEATALSTLDSFQAVSTQIEGLSCQETGSDDDDRQAIVTCQGKLIASYSGELQEFDLSAQEYVVENSTGEWLVCGTK